ncbi:MAG: formyl transferase [Kangiellaceae bacterium]|nr:formyl transferase [Kangiellaceae bacterium]MCW8998531.1 formyl transferase [Kangiellaceae bacterium]MCW9017908.1 formyl transferase [Kangiellaceae bacterium]
MKITILANKDIASNIALNKILPRLSNHEVNVFLSSKVGKSESLPEELQRLKFFEQSLFNELLFPLISKSSSESSGELLSFDGLEKFVQKPIKVLNLINSEEELALYKETEPDLVVSIRYGTILKALVIAVPKWGVINLHSGLLPEYRGVMATFRAMLNGDKTIGTTLHYIGDASIDTGQIIAKSSMPIDKSRSYLWHVLALYSDGCELVLNAIERVAEVGSIPCDEQEREGNYYSFPTAEELEEFRLEGFKLVDEQDVLALSKRYIG